MYCILITIRKMNIIKCKNERFLSRLTTEFICFTENYFKNLVTGTKLEVYKGKKSKCWVTGILLLEKLFDYQFFAINKVSEYYERKGKTKLI